MLREGARIVNARGVPGTLGCVAQALSNDASVMLTTHHVLFGAGARAQDLVWSGGRSVGRAMHGRFGVVSYEGLAYHVDCAVASLYAGEVAATGSVAWAAQGERVTKVGASTGLTVGIVVDVAYSEPARIDGREHDAPRQLLIRSTSRGKRFSESGDSGAVVRNARGAIVGLLWGTSAGGDAVACHIAPAFHVLHLVA